MSDHNAELEASSLLTDHPGIFWTVPPGEVLDMACGGGRNALYVASLKGNPVAACDSSSSSLDLVRSRALAKNLKVRAFELDLEASKDPFEARSYSAIFVFRYLHRPLFENLRNAVRLGGLVFYETFTVDQAQFGRPRNPDYLLNKGELPALFEGWEILHQWEGIQDAPKRAIAQIIARKTSS
jgi:tellurite methyltransferase